MLRHANMYTGCVAKKTLTHARKLFLAFPEAWEKEAWGSPTFRVRKKMFGMYVDNHHEDGRVALWLPAEVGTQDALVDEDPEQFFAPPYMGSKGWIGVRLDCDPDWDDVAELIEDGYRKTAPKKLVAELED
jgi:hypothetical protein